jgi:hypothetical protein
VNTTSVPPPSGQCVNDTTYISTTGAAFELLCGIDWNNGDFFFGYFPDFLSCVNYCAQWNLNHTLQCVAVSFSERNYGPLGPAGGSQCALKFELLEDKKHLSGTDDAILINASANFSAQPTSIPTSGAASLPTTLVADRIVASIGRITLVAIVTILTFI